MMRYFNGNRWLEWTDSKDEPKTPEGWPIRLLGPYGQIIHKVKDREIRLEIKTNPRLIKDGQGRARFFAIAKERSETGETIKWGVFWIPWAGFHGQKDCPHASDFINAECYPMGPE